MFALLAAAATVVAIEGATILTGAGAILDRGTLVFEDGTITAVGRGATVPDDAERIDATGLYLTPGFIDARSTFGLTGRSWDSDRLMTPARQIAGSIEIAEDSGWLRSGVTTTYVSPGGQNLVGGYGAVVKLNGRLVRERAALSVSFGETALEAFDEPTTRQGMIGLLRQAFIRVQNDAGGGEDERALAQVLAREIPLRVLANTPDDILTALRLAEEFGLTLILDSAAGGHEVADAIAEHGAAVVVGPSILGIGSGGSFETFAHTPANAGKLHDAGVTIALRTFASRGRSVVMEGVMAKAHGLDEGATLRALTLDAAQILGVADEIGSLEAGKAADLVLWENHPL